MLMTMPGYSDLAINQRVRILLAFFISLAMFPILDDSLPLMPNTTSAFVMLLFTEVAIGIMIAIGARIFMSAMTVAGEMIAFSAGLQAATLFDPRSGSSTTAPGLFLGMVAAVLIFASGLYLVMVQAVLDSYQHFPPGNLPDLGDSAQAITTVVADMFLIGLKLSAPIVIVGFLGYCGFGIFNRMIPQLQVFFVALPLTIVVGIFLLGLTLGGMVLLFTDQLIEHAVIFTQDDVQF